jgi:hypothetical protein
MKRRQFLTTTVGAASALLSGLTRGQGVPCAPPSLSVQGGGSSNTSCNSSAGAPGWFTSAAHKQWVTPVTNWLGASGVKDPLASTAPNAGNTGHEAIITAWTGMGADQQRKTIWMAGNGGHADYAGNEVYACDLSVASPTWTRRRNASVAAPIGPVSYSKWPDGTPPADHTGMHQVAAEGRWFKLGLGSPNWIGPPIGTQAWEFNPVTNTWIDRGAGLLSDTYGITGCALYDPVDRQLIKIRASGSPAVQFIAVDTFATAQTAGQDMGGASIIIAAIDTQRRILLWRAGSFPNVCYVLNLNNKGAGWSTIPMGGAAPDSTYAFHWHSPSNAFITWDGAGGLKKLTPTISGNTYSAVNWSNVAGAGGPTPSAGTPYLYNKIQLMTDMGNGQSALVVVPRYSNPDVFVMRLTGAV